MSDNITVKEKIKKFESFKESKEKEVEDKKAELKKKKEELEKELKDIEKEGNTEIAKAKEDLKETIKELYTQEKQVFEELERLKKRKKEEELEEVINNEEINENIKIAKGYDQTIKEVLEGKTDFYSITNYNVLNKLEEIASKVSNNQLSKEESEFIKIIEYHAEKLGKDDFYKNKDSSQYLSRELAKIDYIHKKAKEENLMKNDYLM